VSHGWYRDPKTGWQKDPNWVGLNRSRSCTCCDQRHIREHRRVGIPDDPDYAVAVCPNCDLAGAPQQPEQQEET
jgi:hypothetical protein